jgi:4-carboxymuconolactone decarboxylase
MTMRYVGLALIALFAVTISGAGRAAEPTRFTPLKPDELSPPQKE